MTPKSITHVIIPAAGFGKRVGSPPSKELMIYKSEENVLIQWCLDLCKKYGMKPIVISRKNKIELNLYLENYSIRNSDPNTDIYNLETFLIEDSEEWTHTVLQSAPCWGEKNILVLPDTRFSPTEILLNIEASLDAFDLSFGIFEVADFQNWGILSIDVQKVSIAEKPSSIDSSDFLAWGVIGFKKNYGVRLFEKLRESSKDHQFKNISSQKIKFFPLDIFKDVTRVAEDLTSL